MNPRSLRLKLSLAAVSLVVLALLLGGLGLVLIFDKVLDTRTADELNHTAKLLAGQVGFSADGAPTLGVTPADPRFGAPYGGLYWQVEAAGGRSLRSRSLWDKVLVLPERPKTALAHHQVTDVPSPAAGQAIAVVRTVQISDPRPEPELVIVVAMDRSGLVASRSTFLRLLIPSLLALGLILACAMVAFVHLALRPFRALHADMRAIHEGRRTRLPGSFPDEVQPLVDDLNHLLGVQETALQRARAQAADMAHGLKTPLAILSALARRAEAARPDLSREIEEQATAMEGQVERALARARVAAAGGLQKRRCAVKPAVLRLVGALSRLPDASALEWQVSVDADVIFPGDEGDLLEILGNLLDNARKWGRTQVAISGSATAAGVSLMIDDDGPGMTETEMQGIGRGQRWDESKPGTGFGLAIARDLAEATGAAMQVAGSPLGGLRVTLAWT